MLGNSKALRSKQLTVSSLNTWLEENDVEVVHIQHSTEHVVLVIYKEPIKMMFATSFPRNDKLTADHETDKKLEWLTINGFSVSVKWLYPNLPTYYEVTAESEYLTLSDETICNNSLEYLQRFVARERERWNK